MALNEIQAPDLGKAPTTSDINQKFIRAASAHHRPRA